MRTDWSEASSEESQPSSTRESTSAAASAHRTEESKDKDIIVTRLINEHAEDFFAEVMGLIQEEFPERIVKELFNRFHLRLLGLTKRLEFLMEVDRKNLSEVLRLEPEIQEVLAELVPQDRRHEVTWGSFSHLPVQCSDHKHNDADVSREAECVSHVQLQCSDQHISNLEPSGDSETISEAEVLRNTGSVCEASRGAGSVSEAEISRGEGSIHEAMMSKENGSLSHSPVQCSEHQNAEAEASRVVTATKPYIDPMPATPRRAFSFTPSSAKDKKKPYITAIASA
ncbi:hypothetical protein V1264_001900 [Littorina saxatilis]|uniref:Uncharacterized protein n=1 Tax=Littorina saxatilis TaxID=31220 RepID=A0AAN9C3F4_9CAEN